MNLSSTLSSGLSNVLATPTHILGTSSVSGTRTTGSASIPYDGPYTSSETTSGSTDSSISSYPYASTPRSSHRSTPTTSASSTSASALLSSTIENPTTFTPFTLYTSSSTSSPSYVSSPTSHHPLDDSTTIRSTSSTSSFVSSSSSASSSSSFYSMTPSPNRSQKPTNTLTAFSSSSMTTTFKGILVTTVTYTSTVVPVFPAGPSFFHRTGAVVGVFLAVGLAAVAICLLLLFRCTRPRQGAGAAGALGEPHLNEKRSKKRGFIGGESKDTPNRGRGGRFPTGATYPWDPYRQRQRQRQRQGSTIPSSRRPFGLDEWVEMPVSPSSSLRRGLSATSSEFIMNPMGVSNGLNTNHLTSRFDDGSMIEEGRGRGSREGRSRKVSQTSADASMHSVDQVTLAPILNPNPYAGLDPAAEWETLNSQRVVTAPFGGASGMPMDYQLAAGTGYLDPVPEGRLMEAQSDPGHATISRSLSSTNQLAHYSTGSLSRTQSLSHGRTLSATPLVDVGASNDGSGSGSGSAPPSRTVSGSRSSRRGSISPYPIDFNEDNEEDYHRRGQDSFSPTPPPLSPVSPYAPLVEIQPPSPSSPTAPSDLSTPTTTKPVERRNRSSSTDQRLDAGVLRATRKQQRREKSHRREMSPSTTAETTKSRSSSVDQGSSHEDGAEVAGVGDRKDEVDRGRNRDDSDDGSSIDISTADQSALSLVDAQDYTRRVLSSL